MATKLNALKERLAEVNALNAATAIMDWDQQTFMPKGGAAARAQHTSLLSKLAHERFTADETGTLITQAAGEVENGSDDAALLRVVKRDFDQSTKLPTKLVAEKTKLASEAHELWVAARANNDFKSFAPTLEKMFDFAKQEAECFGYKDHIYDALIDHYEEGTTTADCTAMFEQLKANTVDLVKDIQTNGREIDDHILYGDWNTGRQKLFTEMLIRDIGFDMNRGRQDTAPHPFCTGWSVGDIRLTTRYKNYIGSAIFGSLHEAGHGMYEQGSPARMGLHASRWWRLAGRSRKPIPTLGKHHWS